MLERVFDIGLQVSELAATVEALALEPVGVHGFIVHETRDAIGELDLAAGALADALEMVEHARRQQVAADYREVGRRLVRLGLLDDALDAQQFRAPRAKPPLPLY